MSRGRGLQGLMTGAADQGGGRKPWLTHHLYVAPCCSEVGVPGGKLDSYAGGQDIRVVEFAKPLDNRLLHPS